MAILSERDKGGMSLPYGVPVYTVELLVFESRCRVGKEGSVGQL